MIDLIPMTDADLSALHVAVLAEVARRYALATAPAQIQTASAILAAGQHRKPGDPWVQPTGAHDAYALDDTVTRDGRLWRSLIPANVTMPGNPGDPQAYRWWQDMTPAPPVTGTPAWDGNGRSYKVGDKVTYLTKTYACQQAHTSQPGWTPAAVPALWVPSV